MSGNVLWLNGLGEYDFFGRILKDLRILDKEQGLNSASSRDDIRVLDKANGRAKIPPNSGANHSRPVQGRKIPGFMTPIPPPHVPEKRSNMACKHPRVQIVSREEDAEFVECLECGEIFESSEFKDMNIEETKLNEES